MEDWKRKLKDWLLVIVAIGGAYTFGSSVSPCQSSWRFQTIAKANELETKHDEKHQSTDGEILTIKTKFSELKFGQEHMYKRLFKEDMPKFVEIK